MFSEHSSYNLGCFSVLVISPKETYDPRVIWNHGEISGKGVSVCLCGKSDNGLRVPGRGNPWWVCGQTFVGNPAGDNSGA